ncbi:hypothetical protein [Burkholderia sp. Ac-20392]|uniref:hypothetical protein n=1 Tax=Burkholderia sp. Ac-20392 TaxID=2703905 RepID=UPI00197ED099|nr:hypothetical protein [Burkholderia sp. Ac-20392]MBN3799536.1 hypothetical protein [Burkholderia sp. Ac-20392]
MNRTLSTLFAGLLVAALSPVAHGALPASSAAVATAGPVRQIGGASGGERV